MKNISHIYIYKLNEPSQQVTKGGDLRVPVSRFPSVHLAIPIREMLLWTTTQNLL